MKIHAGSILVFESNKYIIKGQIDKGGNGTVWKAEASGDTSVYAVKC